MRRNTRHPGGESMEPFHCISLHLEKKICEMNAIKSLDQFLTCEGRGERDKVGQ